MFDTEINLVFIISTSTLPLTLTHKLYNQMPPKAPKVVKDAAPIAKEAKHKAKAAAKSEAAEKKSAKATPKGKESNSYPRPTYNYSLYQSNHTY